MYNTFRCLPKCLNRRGAETLFDQLFKALSDPTRRQILKMLQQDDMTAGDIAGCFDISNPSISHHLNVLKQTGLVLDERKGQYIYYSLNTTVFQDALAWLSEFMDKKRKVEDNGKNNG
jgi:ArsR family transcriptional regulator